MEQRLRHRTSGTSAYSHTYGDRDDSRNPVSSRDAEVDSFRQGSGNSATQRCVEVMIPVSYAALWEATRERERQRVAARASPVHQEVVGGGHGGGLVGCIVHLSLWDPLYIVGRGAPLPLHQGTRRQWQRRRRRAVAARAGVGRSP
jgi:hypothetical protein